MKKLTAALIASTALALALTPSVRALDLGIDADASVSVDLDVVAADLDAAVGVSGRSSSEVISGDKLAEPGTNKRVVIGAESAGKDTSANGSIEITEVISLIAQSDWSATSLEGASATGATLIVADDIMADAKGDFDTVVAAQADEIAELHAALVANASLSAWLEAEEVAARSVVGIGVTADGSLAIITSDNKRQAD